MRNSTLVTAVLILTTGCGVGNSSSNPATVTVTKTVTAAAPSSGGGSTPGGGVATNLVATASVRQALREDFVSDSTPADAKQTKGPLKGSVYYGEYRGIRYALAAFDVPVVGVTDQPTLFVQLPEWPFWRVVSDTGGGIPDDALIPCALRKTWGFGCGGQP